MKKIFNVLMVMCLVVAAFALTFAICLPGANRSGVNSAPSSVTVQSVNFETSAQPVMFAADYLSPERESQKTTFINAPATTNQAVFRERISYTPNYKIKRSFFDSPLFKNSKALKQPQIFSQPQTRSSPLRR